MDLDSIVVMLSAITGIVSIVTSFKARSRKEKLAELEREIEENKDSLKDSIPESEIDDFKQKVHDVRSKQSGFVDQNFLIYFVPGLIALALVSLYIYLIATNGSAYVAPESLTTLLKLILGFLFGTLASK